MLTAMVIVFLVGYLMIALEHPLKINKAGTALLIGTVLWVMYTYAAPFFIPRASAEEFSLFLESFPSLGSLTFKEQCTRFVVEHQVLDSIGEIAETLIFLIGASRCHARNAWRSSPGSTPIRYSAGSNGGSWMRWRYFPLPKA